LYNTAGVVNHGFAFQTPGGIKLYGQCDHASGKTHLKCICLEPCSLDRKAILVGELDRLASFAHRHRLYLVCWNKLKNWSQTRDTIWNSLNHNITREPVLEAAMHERDRASFAPVR